MRSANQRAACANHGQSLVTAKKSSTWCRGTAPRNANIAVSHCFLFCSFCNSRNKSAPSPQKNRGQGPSPRFFFFRGKGIMLAGFFCCLFQSRSECWVRLPLASVTATFPERKEMGERALWIFSSGDSLWMTLWTGSSWRCLTAAGRAEKAWVSVKW